MSQEWDEIKTVLGELAGASSLCWGPKPKGVFDSIQASIFVNEAYNKIRPILQNQTERAEMDFENKKYEDDWPVGSLEQFIWERCEADDIRVKEIMREIYKRSLLQSQTERVGLDLDEDEIASVCREIDPKGCTRKIARAICAKFKPPQGLMRLNLNAMLSCLIETKEVHQFIASKIAQIIYERFGVPVVKDKTIE